MPGSEIPGRVAPVANRVAGRAARSGPAHTLRSRHHLSVRPEVVSTTTKAIPPSALYELNEAVGWWPERTEADFAFVLAHCPAVGAWVESSLVGFARGITDNRLHGYIDDVMVHPHWRRRGVALDLVNLLVELMANVSVVTLFCSEDLILLYERASFTPTRQVILHRTPRPTVTRRPRE
jgi:GNAT superfamily N-acetyltransferase